jgi:hypothetical protein
MLGSAAWGARADPGPPIGVALGHPPLTQSVSFSVISTGPIADGFHARREGNRVFYAGSAKQARPWLRFTGVDFNYHPDFTRYGLLAIFYREQPGGIPEVESMKAAPTMPAALTANVKIRPFCVVIPGSPPPTCPIVAFPPAGSYILLLIDKTTLIAPPKLLYVTESR